MIQQEPLADWEREFLESPAYQRHLGAEYLRVAAVSLRRQFRYSFALSPLARILELLAKRLERPE